MDATLDQNPPCGRNMSFLVWLIYAIVHFLSEAMGVERLEFLMLLSGIRWA